MEFLLLAIIGVIYLWGAYVGLRVSVELRKSSPGASGDGLLFILAWPVPLIFVAAWTVILIAITLLVLGTALAARIVIPQHKIITPFLNNASIEVEKGCNDIMSGILKLGRYATFQE